jgi:hypothetical protein
MPICPVKTGQNVPTQWQKLHRCSDQASIISLRMPTFLAIIQLTLQAAFENTDDEVKVA